MQTILIVDLTTLIKDDIVKIRSQNNEARSRLLMNNDLTTEIVVCL